MAALDARIRVVVVGYSGAGKTSLIRSLVIGSGPSQVQSTIGIDYLTKNYSANQERVRVTAVFADCGGQTRFNHIRDQTVATADVVLLVLDLSTHGLEPYQEYAQRIRKLAPTAPIVLVGTHVDVLPHEIDGRDDTIAGCMQRHDILEETQARMHANRLFAVSCRTGDGLDDLEEALEHIYTSRAQYQEAFRDVHRNSEDTDASASAAANGDACTGTGTAIQPSDYYLLGARKDATCDTPLTEARGQLAAAEARAIAIVPPKDVLD